MIVRDGAFSSESVSEGHPDKLADRISDAVLDEFLRLDPDARVACETLLADQCVVVAVSLKTRERAVFDAVRERAERIARDVLRATGYTSAQDGVDPERCEVQLRFNHQSPDIAQGVDRADGALGAGDQGLMFGYACDETPERMPAPIVFAHRLVRRLAALRKDGALPWLRPDAKSQVTFRYENGRPVAVETVVLSTQHAPDIGLDELRAAVSEQVIGEVIPGGLRSTSYRELINPTGRFVVGGPNGDTGLTGRKIIVDTYGGMGRHGGGAFSGKDPTKVDRSACYMARYIAKNIVAAGLANRCEVQLAYAIGVAEPVSVMVDTQGTHKISEAKIEKLIRQFFPLTPRGIIKHLRLRRPIYKETARHGHFGRTRSEEHTSELQS